MPSNEIKGIMLRRKKEGKTNYKKRMAVLKSRLPRLVVRKFNKNMLAQIIIYNEKGDRIESSAYSKELEKYGWTHSKTNVPASYLLGLLLSRKTKVKNAILDAGLHTPTKGSRIYACLKGCIDGGVEIPRNDEVMPSDDRITGKHIKEKDVEKNFNEVKQKIHKGH